MSVAIDPITVTNARVLKVLGHPVRLRILELLLDGERTVAELALELDLDLGNSGLSTHLSALRHFGILERRRDRALVYYRLSDERVPPLLKLFAD